MTRAQKSKREAAKKKKKNERMNEKEGTYLIINEKKEGKGCLYIGV